MSAGHSHTACLTEDGRAFTWGMASNGKLGIGATERIGEVYVEKRGDEERETNHPVCSAVSAVLLSTICIDKYSNTYTISPQTNKQVPLQQLLSHAVPDADHEPGHLSPNLLRLQLHPRAE